MARAKSAQAKPAGKQRAQKTPQRSGKGSPRADGKDASATRERTLSEAAIVKKALEIISRNGVDALNMRALADALGVSPMAAYYYVDNKDDLLRLCGDAVFSQVEVPSDEKGTWDERMRRLLVAQRDAMRSYPGLREALTGVDMEQRRRLEDAEIDILLDAGFEPAQAVPAFRTLLSWTLGNAAIESSLRDPASRRPEDRWTKAQRLTFDRNRMPVMHADDYFHFGLDAVLAGLRAVLEGNRGKRRSPAR